MSSSSNAISSKTNKRTLDTQHTNKLYEFQARAEKLSNLKQQYNSLLERVRELEDKRKDTSPASLSVSEIDSLIQLQDEKDKIRKTIDSIENNDDEVDYLVNTANILFKYYDILEKGNAEDAMKPKTENSILKWLVKKDDDEPKQEDVIKEDRAALLDRYMSLTEENFIKPDNITTECQCQNCGSTNMNILLNDGIMYCNECSCVEYIIVDHDRPSYKDPPKEISYFAYKRKMVDALKSHMPRLSEYLSWKNICDLRMMLSSSLQWLVAF